MKRESSSGLPIIGDRARPAWRRAILSAPGRKTSTQQAGILPGKPYVWSAADFLT